MNAKRDTAAPTRRKKSAQGKDAATAADAALGHAFQNTSRPEGSNEGVDIVLPKLPNGWRYASVSQMGATDEQAVLTGPFGTSLGRGDFIDAGIPLLTISCLTEQGIQMDKALFVSEAKAKDLERYRLKSGDLLFSRMASVGRAGIVGPDLEGALFNYHIMRLRLDESQLLPKFFTSYVGGAKQVRDYLLAVNHGATRDGINTEQLLAMPVIVAPLPEQRRIVGEIEKQFTRLEAGVGALRRVQANLKRYRAAVLKAACEGRLVPTETERLKAEGRRPKDFESGEQLLTRILTERRQNWKGRGKYKEPGAPDTGNLPSLSEGWTWATADQLTSVITDGEHITPERSETGILLLSARNVLDGRISFENVDYVPQHEYDRIAKRLVIVPGDVLLSCSGSVGRSAVVPEGLLFTLVRSVAVLKPLAAMGKYLSIALRSPLLKQQILAKQTQTAQANIFQGKIKVLCVPLPPLGEQTRIVAEVERRLSVVEELEAVVTANLQRATRLRQSILQKAFTGELLQRV